MNVACWVVGEYGNETFLNTESVFQLNIDEVISVLVNILHSEESSTPTKCFSLTALMKLASKLPTIEPDVTKAIKSFESCLEPEIQQRCIEWICLSKNKTNLKEIIFDSIPPFLVHSNPTISSELTGTNTTCDIQTEELQNHVFYFFGSLGSFRFDWRLFS
uniref:AP-1 complex subunit gamma-like 2 (Trinotate prediction) n=1 Tax=Myxobolus squamalis TaxID=59785 RepID=A0A6B2GDT5_MYXSQ